MRRNIGPIGTAARIVFGTLLFVFGAIGARIVVVHGALHLQPDWAGLAVGLIGYPALMVAFQWAWSRRTGSRIDETGPLATLINVVGTLGLVIVTIYYLPAVAFLGTGALVFYGASMLLAAWRGYAGCEILAISNLLLRRDDEIGCLWLSPIDALEHQSVRLDTAHHQPEAEQDQGQNHRELKQR